MRQESMGTTFKGLPCLKCGNTLRFAKGTHQCVACAKIIRELWRLRRKRQKVFDYDKKKKRLCYFCKEVKNKSRFCGEAYICKLCKDKKRLISAHYLDDSYIKSLVCCNSDSIRFKDVPEEIVMARRLVELIKRATK